MADPDLLTTTEAATLVGRSPAGIREALSSGRLTAHHRNQVGTYFVERTVLLAWARTAQKSPKRAPALKTWERTERVLQDYGPATAAELAAILRLNPGNVRKHLAILVAQGVAQQLPCGQWMVVSADSAGAA